jgi:phosphohistidine phosphatase SixA
LSLGLSYLRVCFLPLLNAALLFGVAHASPPRVVSPAPPLANAVILIIRHAEKPDTADHDPGLTPAGLQRAADYVSYFQSYKIGTTLLHVNHLIASTDTKHSQRPHLTVDPFSQASGLPIDSRFADKDVDGLAAALKSEPRGKTVLICWHHSEIPALLQDLGADPNTLLPQGKWPSRVFSWVVQMRYDAAGHLLPGQTQVIHEHLLSGDK